MSRNDMIFIVSLVDSILAGSTRSWWLFAGFTLAMCYCYWRAKK